MALSLTSHLAGRRDFGALVRVLEHLGKGEPLDAAFEASFGVSYAELCRAWSESTLQEGSR